jgi:hypothetical protein
VLSHVDDVVGEVALLDYTYVLTIKFKEFQARREGDEDAALDLWREVLGSDAFQPGTRSPEEVLSAWRPRASWQLRIAGIAATNATYEVTELGVLDDTARVVKTWLRPDLAGAHLGEPHARSHLPDLWRPVRAVGG